MPSDSYQSIDQSANRKNLRVLINLRGLAFCAQVGAIAGTYYGLSIVLPVVSMLMTAAILAVLNLYSFYRLRSRAPIGNGDLFAGLVIDVLVLALQLHFSGGTSNPFVSFFMLPVIIGAVMLDAAYAWAIYGLTLAAYLALAIAGPGAPMPDMAMPVAHAPGLIDRSSLHMNGMMLGYAICAGVLVFMIARIRANLRARDAEIEAMRTHALEEDHMVRMGLLSAGAAHELGTPLTTLSVILKDLVDLPLPRRKADLVPDLVTMQTQVERCKAIVSSILNMAGQPRSEGGGVQPLDLFLGDIAAAWQALHPDAGLAVDFAVPPVPVVADRVLHQVLFNLLDNAAEAVQAGGHPGIRLSARVADEVLAIRVQDQGGGFSGDVLSRLGQPYVTTKAQAADGHGRGLGLFLVGNALRKLGGSFTAANVADPAGMTTGGQVEIRLPLAAIKVEGAQSHDI